MPQVTPPSVPMQPVLGVALRVMAPLVRWLLRSGVGYTEFSAALKPVFLAEAQLESERTGGKQTDSALSLLSGLHRKDIRKAAQDAATPARAVAAANIKASLPSQVVARWLAGGLPGSLALSGDNSFESLVRSVSSDVHPRSVQQELVRLGVARLDGEQLELVRTAFMPNAAGQEARDLLADSVADHLSAGVHNLTDSGTRKYLEQAVFADGLSAESVSTLEQLANRLWNDVMTRMVQAAIPLCEHDEPLGGAHRLRLGMFCFAHAPQTLAQVHTDDSEDKQ